MRLGPFVVALILSSLAAFSQTDTATISGSVRDPSGAPVKGAVVDVKNRETRFVYSAVSTGAGTYTVPELPAGQYTITITMPGMKTYAHGYLAIGAGALVREGVALEVNDGPPDIVPDTAAPFKPAILPPARDFMDEDAELIVTKPAMILNGNGVLLPQNPAVVKGKIIWIYLPDHGRYLLSIAPHSELGFSLAGQVNGASLEIQLGDTDIQIEATERIVPGSARYNLYVLQQSGWLPPIASDQSRALMGYEKRADSLLK